MDALASEMFFGLADRYIRPPVWVSVAGLDQKLAILWSNGMSMDIDTFYCGEVNRRHVH